VSFFMYFPWLLHHLSDVLPFITLVDVTAVISRCQACNNGGGFSLPFLKYLQYICWVIGFLYVPATIALLAYGLKVIPTESWWENCKGLKVCTVAVNAAVSATSLRVLGMVLYVWKGRVRGKRCWVSLLLLSVTCYAALLLLSTTVALTMSINNSQPSSSSQLSSTAPVWV